MEAYLRAGIAIYNAGGHHAAHDAWEDYWLDLEKGTNDERFLHGLIQYTAAVYHGFHANWAGLQGLARSGGEYLDGLPAEYRKVDVGTVRAYLGRLAADPEHLERVRPPSLLYGGQALALADLDFEAAAVVAEVLAEEHEPYDEAIVGDAIRYAREAVEARGSDRFVALVLDFATEPDSRAFAYRRLTEHVERRRGREHDVEGLFEP